MFVLTVFSFVELFAQIGAYPEDDQWFSFAVEQNGRPVKIKNNRVRLEKAPFTLVIITRGPIGLLVNFSERDTLFKGFLKNKVLADILEQPDRFMGMGEEDLNPDEKIVIDDHSAHYVYYENTASHRFSNIAIEGEYVIGRRLISNYTSRTSGDEPIPIKQLPADELYLSFMYGDWDENYNRVELQKEALKVIFRK